ncbi:hypothetical protein ACI2JA_06500 [Alkalihalobacillus sp. NPDC078783]
MKYMMTLVSMSILLLAACGQTTAETNLVDDKPTKQVSEQEANNQQDTEEETNDVESEEVLQDPEDVAAAEDSETASSDEVEADTTTTETEASVSATSVDTESDEEKNEETATTETEQGVDEIADPSYTEVTSNEHEEQIAALKNQFSNQLLSVELENGEDWGYVYAVVTDGLKLPSDEEREFHMLQMAEAITEQLELKAQAPGGTITFVYEDQSVLGIYHTEDGSINYP